MFLSSSLISVVTITFNNLIGLKKTLPSVLAQKNVQIESIVIDGGSSDGTLPYLLSMTEQDSRIHYISEPDGGIYDAINKGIDLAKGEYIIFMNASDTFYSDDSLYYLLDTISKSSHQLYALGRAVYHYKDGRIKEDSPVIVKPQCPEICHQALLYKKNIHCDIGYYNAHYRSAADYDFFNRLQKYLGAPFEKQKYFTAVRLKNGCDSSDSFNHTLEMLKIDWCYNRTPIVICRRVWFLTKRFIKKCFL